MDKFKANMLRPGKRIHSLMHLPIRFLLAGVFNTGVSYAVYALCIYIGFVYYAALLCSLIAGAVNNYFTFSRFVFADRARHRVVPRYIIGQVLTYAVSVLSVGALIHIGFNDYLSGFLALPAIAGFSFWFNNSVVFGASQHRAQPKMMDAEREQ